MLIVSILQFVNISKIKPLGAQQLRRWTWWTLVSYFTSSCRLVSVVSGDIYSLSGAAGDDSACDISSCWGFHCSNDTLDSVAPILTHCADQISQNVSVFNRLTLKSPPTPSLFPLMRNIFHLYIASLFDLFPSVYQLSTLFSDDDDDAGLAG